MRAFKFAAVGLLLMPAFCQDGKENDTLATPTSTIKTLHGAPPNSSVDFPLSAREGWTGANITAKMKCLEGNVSNLHVSNATIGYLSSFLSSKVMPTIYLLVFVVGLPANAVTLWKVFFKTTSIAIFHANLAIADTLFCMTLPFKVAYHLTGNHWVFGEVMCWAITVIFYGNMYCSILLLTCMSINRYLAIIHPFMFRRLSKCTFASLACGLVWATVFLYMLPLFIHRQRDYLVQPNSTCPDVHSTCESSSPFHRYHFIALTVFGFLIPLVIIIYCYTNIICQLNVHDPKLLRYIKAILLILVVFTICFVPSNIIFIIYHANYYSNNSKGLYVIYLVGLCLGSLNSCLNPFLYFLMSKVTEQLRM
ncbi:PREDICTED: proteinase-activated receptor 3 [Chinchilla lanigera]|uniref:Coagulation factor II thrombin receptor like 2 n=1 Tax=Chinchilla lanigera TaxID=34839 RepID=A0A8C2YRT3_CHILA|nr:PREDICTED: proteinase-activated receptor 3 [Chinchilla lanigera]